MMWWEVHVLISVCFLHVDKQLHTLVVFPSNQNFEESYHFIHFCFINEFYATRRVYLVQMLCKTFNCLFINHLQNIINIFSIVLACMYSNGTAAVGICSRNSMYMSATIGKTRLEMGIEPNSEGSVRSLL